MKVSGRQSGADRKKSRSWLLLIIIVIVVILGIVIALNRSGSGKQISTEESEESKTSEEISQMPEKEETQDSAEETDAGLEFPYSLDDDRIQVDSLFQYSGINPDAQNQECENVASIQVKNNSGQYLESAEISLELTDGTAFSFTLQDIPADKTVMAFDTSNATYDGKTGAAFIDAKTSYSSDAGISEGTIKITSDDNGQQLSNISGETIETVKVKYHCILDDMYFGGLSSETEIDRINAGESAKADTSDSILGDAEIVSVTY